MRILPPLAFALFAPALWAAPHELALPTSKLAALDALPVSAHLIVDGFPDGTGNRHRLRFTRIDPYAPGARLIVIGPDGEHDIPRSSRIELIGSDDSGTVRAHLAFDHGFRNVVGSGLSPAGAFVIHAPANTHGARLVVQPADEALPAGITPQVQSIDDALPNPQAKPTPLLSLGLDAVAAASRSAIVAVDVDKELLVNRFGGTTPADVTEASNWIADLFATMNVIYERDLDLTLLQGITKFRTNATPYVIKANQAADSTDLSNFGNYWKNNHSDVPRSFAMLLSGQMTSGNSASGIAWINAYCSNTYSYSVNKVFTNPGIGVSLSASIVAHELGHNLGAAHTHCTNVATGNYPTATNTIDQCSTQGSGCYSGPTSCPSSGPGAPAGTLMSYCNMISCGSTHQNVLQFHPTQITTLSALLAQNTPACIAVNNDQIFDDGFDS